MADINMVASGREADTFDDRQIALSYHRNLYRVTSEGNMAIVEPKVLTQEEALKKLDAVGRITRVESYLDIHTGFKVLRGIIEIDGWQRYWVLVHDVLYEAMVDGMIGGLVHSRRVPEDMPYPVVEDINEYEKQAFGEEAAPEAERRDE